jgi:hypothetical protein
MSPECKDTTMIHDIEKLGVEIRKPPKRHAMPNLQNPKPFTISYNTLRVRYHGDNFSTGSSPEILSPR